MRQHATVTACGEESSVEVTGEGSLRQGKFLHLSCSLRLRLLQLAQQREALPTEMCHSVHST